MMAEHDRRPRSGSTLSAKGFLDVRPRLDSHWQTRQLVKLLEMVKMVKMVRMIGLVLLGSDRMRWVGEWWVCLCRVGRGVRGEREGETNLGVWKAHVTSSMCTVTVSSLQALSLSLSRSFALSLALALSPSLPISLPPSLPSFLPPFTGIHPPSPPPQPSLLRYPTNALISPANEPVRAHKTQTQTRRQTKTKTHTDKQHARTRARTHTPPPARRVAPEVHPGPVFEPAVCVCARAPARVRCLCARAESDAVLPF
jgi:hypothetical protein